MEFVMKSLVTKALDANKLFFSKVSINELSFRKEAVLLVWSRMAVNGK